MECDKREFSIVCDAKIDDSIHGTWRGWQSPPRIFPIGLHNSGEGMIQASSLPLLLLLFSLFSMTCLGNTKKVVLSRCRLLIYMTNGIKLSY